MARNIEVLRNYFLGKDPQLKETMADNSLRLIGIEGKHFILRTELLARLGELKNYVNDRDRELQGAIDDVDTDLGTEILNRQTEDLALGNRISNEILDRAAADTSLGNRISSLENWKNTTDFVLDEDLIQALSDYYTKAEVNQLISVIPRFDIEVVQSLPVQDISETTIYLVPSSDPQTRNDYDEFIYVSNQWEQIGSTAIDLSDYYTKTEVDSKVTFTKLTANITLPEHSATITGLTESGWYNTGNYVINWENHLDNPIMPNDTLFYYDITQAVLLFVPQTLDLAAGPGLLYATFYFDSLENKWAGNSYQVTDTINNQSTDYLIPTAGAVYTALQSKQNTLTAGDNIKITNNVIDTKGTTIKSITNPRIWNMEDGLYLVSGNLYYNGASGVDSIGLISNQFLQVNGDREDNPFFKYWTLIDNKSVNAYICSGRTDQSSGTYNRIKVEEITDFMGTDGQSDGVAGLVPAPTTIDDGKFLCADGTWQQAGGGSNITYGTTDLTPGVSPLAEGTFYFQYE